MTEPPTLQSSLCYVASRPSTAGSRQPTLGRRRGCFCWCAFRTSRACYSSHGWLTPAAPVARRRFGEKCAICDAHTNVRKSGGRARYERESSVATGEHTTKSGGREPAVVCDTNALLRELSTVRQSANTHPGAAGVSPPCARSVERCLRFVADHLQVRSPTHGWLTPAALGRRRGCFCWCAFRTGERATHRTAGLRQPLLIADADAFAGVRFIPAITPLISRLAHASRSWSQTRMLLPVCVSYPRLRHSSHGWLTPAALGRSELVVQRRWLLPGRCRSPGSVHIRNLLAHKRVTSRG
jgi:hypothetical protein